MGNKLTPKVILEGTQLTFKTEIAFELNEHPRVVGARKYRYHSSLISAEWRTFTNYPWGRRPINFEPHEESLAMGTYVTWARMLTLQSHPRIVDAWQQPPPYALNAEISSSEELASNGLRTRPRA